MPNWCYNTVVFSGERAAELFNELKKLESAQMVDPAGNGVKPDYVDADAKYMFAIYLEYAKNMEDQNSFSLNFETRWSPSIATVLPMAEKYELDFDYEYQELDMELYGVYQYTKGELLFKEVTHAEFEQIQEEDCGFSTYYNYEDQTFDSMYDILDIILENKPFIISKKYGTIL
jgi:hypothetical protein